MLAGAFLSKTARKCPVPSATPGNSLRSCSSTASSSTRHPLYTISRRSSLKAAKARLCKTAPIFTSKTRRAFTFPSHFFLNNMAASSSPPSLFRSYANATDEEVSTAPQLFVTRHGERIDFVDATWWDRSTRYRPLESLLLHSLLSSPSPHTHASSLF